ncbi:NUDIX domain-containing protein [Candidatus Aciduliprofundum boonei]|uniref:NUDIX hydrolase n=1 Tax=Aciduliprofundum boonei (strain DSM 19572 / T469) TaxID=439481 RepID=B5IH58_ACIB4|nr:NUDIX domain-containing protein [Candidatus Aciduliprofundum boonei]ADD08895.1 NUDIX hydrolase [Aciduliprofundum boonei T469]EDY34407.1 hydrolase, NUDIX family protein [Aciduliprofundum boonei T469]HII54790.1 NUDIX domain-containing protein [Candidatus Aciduliprofundum boonei]
MIVKYRFWFESPAGYVFGPGSYQILKEIEKTGSLRKAASNLGMSYRHAWGLIKEIEENLGVKIITSHRGGREGGESTITEEGIKLLREYEKYEKVFDYVIKHPYIKPSITVDGILVEDEKILLVKRGREPFKGMYALPGGFVEYGERTEDAIVREMEEETGLKTEIIGLVGVYSDPKRDPRDHTITVVYELRRLGGKLKGGDDATYATMFPLNALPELAFDHAKIIEDFKNMKFNR